MATTEIDEVKALIDASRNLDRAVLDYGLTHQATIGKYMSFRVALRALDPQSVRMAAYAGSDPT